MSSSRPRYDPPPGLPPDCGRPIVDLEAGEDASDDRRHLIADIKDYQLTHGNLLKLVGLEESTRVPTVGLNVSLAPTPFPRAKFEEAVRLQITMNELYIRCASDPDWLYSVLRAQIEGEPEGVMAALWDIYCEVQEAGTVQDVFCGIFRSDYMLHAEDQARVTLKQVEFNSFFVAGACHSESVAGMHSYLLKRNLAGMVREVCLWPISRPLTSSWQGKSKDLLRSLPGSDNIETLATGLANAHTTYESVVGRDVDDCRTTCVLMVVQPHNFNVADERPLEYALWNREVPCLRCDWLDLLDCCEVNADRILLYTDPTLHETFEVSVVYYRAGYSAAEYAPENGRSTRIMLEMSRAIKCPSLLMQMAGFKTVQKALAQDGALDRFLRSEDGQMQRATVQRTFMPMHVLDRSPEGLQARKLALNPETVVQYVLKPNMDGGGNNVFGEDIPIFLADTPESEWHRFVLMRLIAQPEGTRGTLMTEDGIYEGSVVSELGILGFATWRCRLPGATGGIGNPASVGGGAAEVDILENKAAGWTFKTKPRGVDEMSVVKGYGCFDCPSLS